MGSEMCIRDRLLIILEKYDRKIRDTVFSNIDSKKVKKNSMGLVKPAYICRLLMELYKKVKVQKKERLREIFFNVYRYNRI